jgi:hypothetical protein
MAHQRDALPQESQPTANHRRHPGDATTCESANQDRHLPAVPQ